MNSGIIDILNGISSATKELNIKELPTQGVFYPADFTLNIRKASFDDIMLYNFNYIKDDLGVILKETKRIIRKNIILGDKYKYEDLKSNDLLYIFFEIVKFTMSRDITVSYVDIFGNTVQIPFCSANFNYFNYDSLKCEYNDVTREFIKDGYRFSLPSVGVENCLVEYICALDDRGEYTDVNYDFLFFLGNKNYLSYDEMDNLVTIFNEDLDDIEKEKISNIIKLIYPAIGYTLKWNNKIVGLDMKIDFEKLFI
jgi:hypothetical protein